MMNPLATSLRTRQVTSYVCSNCTRQLRRQRRRYATSAVNPEIYDVVCVGGGPAGLSLLAALRTSQHLALFASYSLTIPRLFTGHSKPQSRARGKPIPGPNTQFLAAAHAVLEPLQLTHAVVGAVPGSDWGLETCEAREGPEL